MEEYINCEYSIVITKKKGEPNSIHMYRFKQKRELLTGIASMTEQLIGRQVLTKADILMAVRLGAKRGEHIL